MSIASSSKSPLAHSREDLSPLDTMAEQRVHNEFQLSERVHNLYPYPERLTAEVLVPYKLKNPYLKDTAGYVEWNKNYVEWRQKMLDVITSQGLLGFIDGTVQAPPKTVITSVNDPNGCDTIHKERELNEEYVAWKRSDDLVGKWIMDRLPLIMRRRLPSLETAKDLWEVIARQEQQLRMDHYLPLYKAAIKGDWKLADEFIQKEQDAVSARITVDSETALIVAVKMAKGKGFVEKLVEKMSRDALAICDNGGRTALHRAAGFGNIEVAKLLVEKNQDLPNMETHLRETPLFYAVERGDRKMVERLMVDTAPKLLWGERGFRILYQLTHSQLYDIALNVLRKNKEWAVFSIPNKEDLKFHALNALAEKTSSFPSGNNFNFLQKLIYSRMKSQIKKHEGPTKKNEGKELKADNHTRGDTEAPLASNNSGVANGGRGCAVKKILHTMSVGILDELHSTMNQLLITIKPIREIREKTLLHDQALKLLQFLCNQVTTKDFLKAERIFQLPLERSTMLGIHEIVEKILELYPYAVYLENYKKQTIFQQAIVFRQEKVFNLIHQLEESTRAIVLSKQDTSNNNALHLVGYVPQKLYVRGGAALQMQRELQWFKEVDRLGPSTNREERNNEEKTPQQVFSETHEELVKKGEQWMKDTANSCTIVASLIATVVFAAAIQVPGGNNDNGRPIFDQQRAFIIFGIANSLALFFSIASVVMFLSILTSPCAEEDFLFALPNRMIIGLGSLFFSILCTMTAFGAILYLVFGENKGWILIPVVALGCYPVCLFVALQFPFLMGMMKSTYGSGIFKQSDRISNRLDIKKRL